MPHHKTLLKAFRFLENLAALFFLLLRHKFSSIACVKLVNFNAGKRKSRKFGSLGVMNIYIPLGKKFMLRILRHIPISTRLISRKVFLYLQQHTFSVLICLLQHLGHSFCAFFPVILFCDIVIR
jgi:hypothetical protein